MPVRSMRSRKLELRVSPKAQKPLVRAAALVRRSRGDFGHQGVGRFALGKTDCEAFVAVFDAAPADNPGLKRLLARPDMFAGR